MVTLWYLLVLAPVIAIPFFWWNYQRKQAARERLANERWQSVVQSASKAGATAAGVESRAPTVLPNAAAQSYRRRERILEPADTLAYYLLRSGLPDCEVLVRVRLDQLIMATDPVPGGRVQAMTQQVFDFVVCNKAMQPLAAIDLLDGEAAAALTAAPDFKVQCLSGAGLRYVRLLRTALPKRQDVRSVVMGPGIAD